MDFTADPTHEDIRKAVRDMCKPFDDDYWMRQDMAGEFPWGFYNAVVEAGWLGLSIPEEYGGAGLGVAEASIVEQEISASGAGMSGCSAVHTGSSPCPAGPQPKGVRLFTSALAQVFGTRWATRQTATDQGKRGMTLNVQDVNRASLAGGGADIPCRCY